MYTIEGTGNGGAFGRGDDLWRRIDRLRELRELMAKQQNPEGETSTAETVVAVSGVVG